MFFQEKVIKDKYVHPVRADITFLSHKSKIK